MILQHQKGYRWRIVSDSNYEDRAAIQSCIRAGIPVVFDKREAFMHNKFCVVDDSLVDGVRQSHGERSVPEQ